MIISDLSHIYINFAKYNVKITRSNVYFKIAVKRVGGLYSSFLEEKIEKAKRIKCKKITDKNNERW